MKPKSAMLLGGAMVCGLMASYIVAKMAGGATAEEKVQVPVAKKRVPFGTRIDKPEDWFKPLQVPASALGSAVTNPEDMKGKFLNRTIPEGQWVMKDDLTDNHGLEPEKGYVGMAIKVTPDSAVGGFIMPGSYVDVIANIRTQRGNIAGSQVQTVLHKKKVLAIDQQSIRPDDKMAVNTIDTVTLQVKPVEAAQLEWALNNSTNNRVRLLLRQPDDDTVPEYQPIRGLQMTIFDDDDNPASPDNPAAPATLKVLVAKDDIAAGTKISDVNSLFSHLDMLTAPEDVYTEKDLPQLKDRTIERPVMKGNLLLTRHLQADPSRVASAAPTPSQPRPKVHVMFVQNGGKEVKKIIYRDGFVVPDEDARRDEPDNSDAAPPAAAAPAADAPAADAPPAIAPAEKKVYDGKDG